MVKPVLHILFILIPFLSIGQQNLVPNSNFEDYITCPSGVSDFTVLNWTSPNGGSSDYFNSCNATNVSVPSNLIGFQEAHSGNGYCGFVSAFTPPSEEAREYIQIQLKNELEAGKDYHFSGYFSLADSSRYCVKNLGIAFSTNAIGGSSGTAIMYSPIQLFSQNYLLCNIHEWVEMNVNYTSHGGEKYLTIGLFFDDANSLTEIVNPQKLDYAYYYIDDVSVIEMSIGLIPNILTPNEDGTNDIWETSVPSSTEFHILNRWGEIIYNGNAVGNIVSWNGKTIDGNDCNDGVYYYQIFNQSETKTGFIQLIRNKTFETN